MTKLRQRQELAEVMVRPTCLQLLMLMAVLVLGLSHRLGLPLTALRRSFSEVAEIH